MKVVLATKNEGKIKEMKAILADLPLTILTLHDFPDVPVVDENGEDFFANAFKKAQAAAQHTGLPAVADDSGLVVDALGGLPGVKSARYAGETATDDDNIEKLLAAMSDIPDERRRAAFRCVIVYYHPSGTYETWTGEWEGRIAREKCGHAGFGYDPVFFVPKLGKTAAELAPEEKNRYSHRRKALDALRAYLQAQGS